jgi:hypothetical protein
MTSKTKIESNHLLETKRAQSLRYARLARQTKSAPKRKQFNSRSEKYRRQAEELARQ